MGSILTTIGQTKLNSATPLDQLNITHLAVGDGSGTVPTIDPSMTALVNEVWRGAASAPVRDANNANTIIFEATIPPSIGGFVTREIGIFDIDGDMIAVGTTAIVEKPDPLDSVGVALTCRIFIALDNATDVDLIYQDGGVINHGGLANRNPVAQAHTAEAISYDGTNVKQHLDDLAASGSTKLVGGSSAGKIGASVGYLTPEQFFIAGEVDATAMLMRLGADIVEGSRVEFQEKEYLISYAGTGLAPYAAAPYGAALLDLSDKKNVKLNGNNCTIKLVNHDIATNGGLMFCRGEFAPNFSATGFNFDFSCTGVNTSASYYPWVGGFVIFDPATGTNDETKISNDIYFGDMTFKMFHPNGQWSTTSNPYFGDPNNGYKLFTIFASGDYLAATKPKQNKNLTMENITVKDGHNGYGLWAWAYNNVKFINPTAENYSAKYTNSAGAFVGVGVPFIRYHQFLCTDVLVENINFNGRKSSEKVGAFAGGNPAINFTTNNAAAGYTHGNMEVKGGIIRGGNGDLANLAQDQLILCTAYGVIKVRGVYFDAQPIDANSIVGGGIVYSAEATNGTGYGEIHISDVVFSKNCDQYQNVQILNGVATSAADRRCKLLKIDNMVSMCQHQYGLDLSGNSTADYQGVERVIVDGMLIDGRACQTFTSAHDNSRAMFLTSEPGDILEFNNVTVDSKYHAISVSDMDAASEFTINNYVERGVTSRYLGAGKIACKTLRGNGSPEGVQVAAVGSTYSRLDGGAGTSYYVKEPSTDSTGWIAK